MVLFFCVPHRLEGFASVLHFIEFVTLKYGFDIRLGMKNRQPHDQH
jgi:hypothetical protein